MKKQNKVSCIPLPVLNLSLYAISPIGEPKLNTPLMTKSKDDVVNTSTENCSESCDNERSSDAIDIVSSL